jgi:putative Mg2+ transporter-C (MgtC) family protein
VQACDTMLAPLLPGARSLVEEGGSIRGVTTAPAVWTSAALGMAAGAGERQTAAAGLVVVLVALVGLRLLRDRCFAGMRRRWAIEVTYARGRGTLAPIITALEHAGADLATLHIDDDTQRRVRIGVRSRNDQRLKAHVEPLCQRPEVRRLAFIG